MHLLSEFSSIGGRNECQENVKTCVYLYPLVRGNTWEPCSDFLQKCLGDWGGLVYPNFGCHINRNNIPTVSSSVWSQMTFGFRPSQSIEKYRYLIFWPPAIALTKVLYLLLSELLTNPWDITVRDSNSLCWVWVGEGFWQAEPVHKNI